MSPMTRRRPRAVSAFASAAVVLLAGACGSAAGGGSEPVKIVALGAFTGKSASQNAPVLQGAKVAQAVLNKEGGIGGRKVELVVEDDRGEIASMVTAAREAAADDDVYAVLVGNGTPGALAVQPVLQRSGVAAFSVATSPKLTKKVWPSHYRMNSNAADEARRLVKDFTAKGGKALGVLWENDDYGSGFEGAMRAAAKAAGVKIASSVSVAPGSNSLTPEVAKLTAAGVDYLTTALLPAETVTASRAFEAAGLRATVAMNGADMAFPAERALLGDAGDGIMFRYFTYPFDPVLQKKPGTPVADTDMSAEAKKFWPVWQKRYGKQVAIAGHKVAAMPTYDWWSYDAIRMVAKAVEDGAAHDGVVAKIDKTGSYKLVATYSDLGAQHEFHGADDMAFGRLKADGTIEYGVK